MNHFDYLLSATNPRQTTSNFTLSVMQQINSSPRSRFQIFITKWKSLNAVQQTAAGMIIAAIMTVMTISSYAYAIGTDPISLIMRWVSGNTVHINYDGRQFTHGTKLTYSDAAITAYAELNTTDLGHFRAASSIKIPVDGVEYVDNPTLYGADNYIAPKLAYVSRQNSVIHIREVYERPDKLTPAKHINVSYDVSLQDFKFYKQLKLNGIATTSQEVLVALYQDDFLQHIKGSGNIVTPIRLSFAFALSHPEKDYVELYDVTEPRKQYNNSEKEDPRLFGLMEESFGTISSTCMNNGADDCGKNYDDFSKGKGEGLYGYISDPHGQQYLRSNPSLISGVGEGAADTIKPTKELINRGLNGNITHITTNAITIKTSSGSQWTLDYSQTQQHEFARFYKKKLAVGNTITGMIYQSIYDLDERKIQQQYIYNLVRL